MKVKMLKVEVSLYMPWRHAGGSENMGLAILNIGSKWGWATSVMPGAIYPPPEKSPKMFYIVVPYIIFFSDQATQFSQYPTKQHVNNMLPILWTFRKVRIMKYVHHRAWEIGLITGRKIYFV